MEEGYLPDVGYGSYKLTSWARGAARWGTFFKRNVSLKMRRVEQLGIESWRCTRCGYLENYAPG